MTRETMSDVIVLVPGILGSVLQKNGRDVWAASGGAALAGLLSGGAVYEIWLSKKIAWTTILGMESWRLA